MNIKRIANSIVTRLLILGIVVVLLGSAVRYVRMTDFLRTDLTVVVAAQQEALANYVAHDIDYKIVERQAMLKQLAATLPLDLLQQPASLQAWLKERHLLQPLFSIGLFITDLNGQAFVDYPPLKERSGTDFSDRDYIRAGLAGKSAIGRPIMGRSAKEPVLPMAEPIKDAQGRVRAVLVGITALAAPGFLDLLQKTHVGKQGGFLLISPQDHLFVAASVPEMILKPTPAPGINVMHDKAMAGFRGSGITVNAQGVEHIAAFASVPSTGWFVVARLPTAEAFATVAHTQNFMIKHMLVVITVFLLLASLALFHVFRPLLSAADHANRMTRGELPLEALPVARSDEVGHLTEAFNRLLAKLQSSQSELARAAHHDPLTGLPNRLLLADRMSQALARAHRNHTRLALLFLDLDGFKAINDDLGHEAGDDALVEVARRLSSVVREADTLARIGGDEFVVVMSDLDGSADDAEHAATSVAGKCIEAIRPALTLKGESRSIGVSIGIALGDGQSSADGLMLAADNAMYRVKQAGRGHYLKADDFIASP